MKTNGKMECTEIKELLMPYAMQELSDAENEQIRLHIDSCDGCKQELEEIKSFLSVINTVEEESPSDDLKANFENMLAEEIKNLETPVVELHPKNDWKSFLRIAASIAIVCGAFFLGKMSNYSENTSNNNQQQEVLALLENQSASKRILAISKTTTAATDDFRIIDALINKMFIDKNSNVRLAAVEALVRFSTIEKVRDSFIKALETEQEPSVQIELIQILADIQEKRALVPMKKLLENEETPNYVKQELAYSIPNLI